ncbi:MAG: inositol monophosphatase family protein [Myxococcota bacterium]
MTLDLDHALRIATQAARAAGQAELTHFRPDIAVETKPDRSPVTAADKEGEAIIRKHVLGAFPDHGFLGEESGGDEAAHRYRWIVDPIDGTRGFTRGGKFWGPLIALAEGEEVLVGVLYLPALGDLYAAKKGGGTTKNDQPVHVSGIARWEDATISLGEMQNLLRPPLLGPISGLATTAASARGYGDLAGAAMVIDGRAEAFVETGVKIWDLAPIRLLVEEAGGRFTDLHGAHKISSGSAIVTNGKLHDHVLHALKTGR